MKISKQGITFEYNNDEITWYWWWARQFTAFYSFVYNFNFNSFKEYWMFIGQSEKPLFMNKLQGFPLTSLIDAWVRQNCRVGDYVLLYDINPQAKPAYFWRSIPDRDKVQLNSDIVLLKCKSSEHANSLLYSIPKTFARTVFVRDGKTHHDLSQPET